MVSGHSRAFSRTSGVKLAPSSTPMIATMIERMGPGT